MAPTLRWMIWWHGHKKITYHGELGRIFLWQRRRSKFGCPSMHRFDSWLSFFGWVSCAFLIAFLSFPPLVKGWCQYVNAEICPD